MKRVATRSAPGAHEEREGKHAVLTVHTLTFEAPPPAASATALRGARAAALPATSRASAGASSPARRQPQQPPAATRRNQRPRLPPPPVEGRQHCEAQTDAAILEALELPFDAAAGTQTDASLPCPLPLPPPAALAHPVGLDASTQLAAGELFDWERDGAPVVELLVGQALAQAAAEAGEELRLAALQRRRQELEEARYREQQEVLRLQADASRRAEVRAARQRDMEAVAALRAAQEERQQRQGAEEAVAAEEQAGELHLVVAALMEDAPMHMLEQAALELVVPALEGWAAAELTAAAAAATCGEKVAGSGGTGLQG